MDAVYQLAQQCRAQMVRGDRSANYVSHTICLKYVHVLIFIPTCTCSSKQYRLVTGDTVHRNTIGKCGDVCFVFFFLNW